MSTRDIPKQEAVPKKITSKIQRIIVRDSAEKLSLLLEKEVIRFDAEVGTSGSGWNILHFCAKSDSSQCIEYVLKTQYQDNKD